MVSKCVVLSFYDLLDRNQVDCGFDIKRWSKGRKSEFAIRILRNQHQILLLIWTDLAQEQLFSQIFLYSSSCTFRDRQFTLNSIEIAVFVCLRQEI